MPPQPTIPISHSLGETRGLTTHGAVSLRDMGSGEPVLTLVANVRSHRFHGESGEVRAGTKHFSGGTKVTFKSSYGGSGHVEVTVIGRHRKSKKLITIDLQRRYLENWRVQAVYSPAVLSRLVDRYHKERTADDLQQTADGFNESRFFYAFERPMDGVRSTIESLWGDDVPAGLQQLIGAPHLGYAVAYQDGPGRPIGAGILNEHRHASTFFGPGFVDQVGRESAVGALRTRLGIVNQRLGDELGLRHLRVHWKHAGRGVRVVPFDEAFEHDSQHRQPVTDCRFL